METAQKLDTKAIIAGWTHAMTDMYCKDLKAMTDEQFVCAQPGKARSASALTADALSMAIYATNLLTDPSTEFQMEADMNRLVGEMTTIEEAVRVVSETGAALSQAIGSASDEKLAEIMTPPWGGPSMPMFLFVNIAANHLWYHDGQINFIQAMNGDEAVHWMDQ
ncbi:MAG: DinB family protein [Fimbriimonadaceae bacterium]